jgi:hemoglobin/transferrin/lactoferrin receptor protein
MQGLSRTACRRRAAPAALAALLLVLPLAHPPSLAAAPPDDPASAEAPVFEDEVQVTATRAERRPEEVPAPVSVVTRSEIEAAAAVKPGDLFPELPGVEVEGNGPFLGLPVIRGMAGNRVLVLVDGHRLNNSREAINFGGVQPSLVDVEQIEEIEITRGPASVLYGTDAIGGIVNLITRSPRVPTEGLVYGGGVRTQYDDTADGRSAAADLHVASPGWTLFLDGSVRDFGDYESPEGTIPNSGAESDAFHAELERRIADGHSVEVDYQRFRGSDIGVPGTDGVFTGSYPFTDRDAVSLFYQGRGPGALGRWMRSIEASAHYQEQTESFATVLDLPPIPAGPFHLSIDTETERVGDVETAGVDLLARAAAWDSHLLTYGVQFFRDEVSERRNETSVLTFAPTFPGPPPFTETNVDDSPTTPEGSFQGLGVFVQDEITLDRWTILPGVRYDRFDIDTEPLVREEGVQPAESRSEDAVSASLGALYRVSDSWSLAASAGRAFRTPNLIERYFFGPGSQGGLTVPNPDLDNETSLNFDLGAKLHARRLRGSITGFRNEIDGYITFVPGELDGQPTLGGPGGQPITTVDNIGEARLQGIEAEAEFALTTHWKGAQSWRLFGNATYTRAENLSSDLTRDEPLFVAPFKAVAGVHWHAAELPVGASFTARWVDAQDRVPEGFSPTESFTVADLGVVVSLERWLGYDLDLRTTVENLTDEAYTEPYGAVLEPGRSYVVAVDLDLRSDTP